MVERGHQVGFAETAFSNHRDRTTLAGADRLDPLQQVVRWVGDLQKLLGGDLGRARPLVVGQLNGRALKAFAPKFLP